MDKEEFSFSKCFKTQLEYTPKNYNGVIALVSCECLDTEYIEKFYNRKEIFICKKKEEYLLKLQEIATEIKILTKNTSFDVKLVVDTIIALEKANFFSNEQGYITYWKADNPFIFVNGDENALIVAPKPER